MEWISTGVDGLDALIQGYPKGKTFLVSGVAGAGKTILALHFLNACKTKKIANANLIRLNTQNHSECISNGRCKTNDEKSQ